MDFGLNSVRQGTSREEVSKWSDKAERNVRIGGGALAAGSLAAAIKTGAGASNASSKLFAGKLGAPYTVKANRKGVYNIVDPSKKTRRSYRRNVAGYGASGAGLTAGIATAIQGSEPWTGKEWDSESKSFKKLKRDDVGKAYDPEGRRGKRLDRYADASIAASGAGAVLGGQKLRGGLKRMNAASQVGNLKNYKSGMKTAGKGGAITAAALGAGVGASRIRNYKNNRGASYRSMGTVGF